MARLDQQLSSPGRCHPAADQLPAGPPAAAPADPVHPGRGTATEQRRQRLRAGFARRHQGGRGRPLTAITATAQRLSVRNLKQRIRLTGPQDEIKTLANTFDAMLDRLADAFDSQRHFIANASHELRTPQMARGDPVLLEQLVGNLLDNAIKYNRTSGWIRIRLDRQPTNSGPVVPADEVEGLFEPFKRHGTDRTDGKRT